MDILFLNYELIIIVINIILLSLFLIFVVLISFLSYLCNSGILVISSIISKSLAPSSFVSYDMYSIPATYFVYYDIAILYQLAMFCSAT